MAYKRTAARRAAIADYQREWRRVQSTIRKGTREGFKFHAVPQGLELREVSTARIKAFTRNLRENFSRWDLYHGATYDGGPAFKELFRRRKAAGKKAAKARRSGKKGTGRETLPRASDIILDQIELILAEHETENPDGVGILRSALRESIAKASADLSPDLKERGITGRDIVAARCESAPQDVIDAIQGALRYNPSGDWGGRMRFDRYATRFTTIISDGAVSAEDLERVYLDDQPGGGPVEGVYRGDASEEV